MNVLCFFLPYCHSIYANAGSGRASTAQGHRYHAIRTGEAVTELHHLHILLGRPLHIFLLKKCRKRLVWHLLLIVKGDELPYLHTIILCSSSGMELILICLLSLLVTFMQRSITSPGSVIMIILLYVRKWPC